MVVILAFEVTGCGNQTIVTNFSKTDTKQEKSIDLTENPNKTLIIERLSKIPTLSEFSFATEDNDPNGQLGKQKGYSDSINFVDSRAPKIEGCYHEGVKTTCRNSVDKGTDGGGAIEIYSDSKYANSRTLYFDALPENITGRYKLVGKIIIRISYKMTASQQKDLEEKIISVLK